LQLAPHLYNPSLQRRVPGATRAGRRPHAGTLQSLTIWERVTRLPQPEGDPARHAYVWAHANAIINAYHLGALPLAVRLVDRSLPLAQENRAIYLNAACVYAGGLGDADRALEMVRAAVEGGWPDPEQIRTDDDLTLLYGNPEFQALFDRPAPDGEPSKESDRATG
jgi:hypothetical protein